ncbi:hypothetical protein D0439_22375 [Lysinibacillus fusiformis]|nr:hypothetical protein D0439_22375 [Lysinibacillus fusiformis]
MPREVAEAPSTEIVKTQLDTVLGNLLWVTPLEQGGWTRSSQEVPSNLNHSVIQANRRQLGLPTAPGRPSYNRGGHPSHQGLVWRVSPPLNAYWVAANSGAKGSSWWQTQRPTQSCP